jgi:hypothetical protein
MRLSATSLTENSLLRAAAHGGDGISPGAHGGALVSPAKVAIERTAIKVKETPSLFRLFMFFSFGE